VTCMRPEAAFQDSFRESWDVGGGAKVRPAGVLPLCDDVTPYSHTSRLTSSKPQRANTLLRYNVLEPPFPCTTWCVVLWVSAIPVLSSFNN
jgi:hypothetical protein